MLGEESSSRVSPMPDHAPSRFWPQTRTVLPLTAADAGSANQAIVSATSTGRPPCARLDMRRPASRVPIGIAAGLLGPWKPGGPGVVWASRLRWTGADGRAAPGNPGLVGAAV